MMRRFYKMLPRAVSVQGEGLTECKRWPMELEQDGIILGVR